MDWLTNLFNQVVTVSNAISSITSLLGFITLLATLLGYLITNRDGGFGPKYNKEARYYKFFRFIAEELTRRDKEFKPPRTDVERQFANYESIGGLKLRAHFVPSGRFGVYLNLEGEGAEQTFKALGVAERKRTLESRLGLDKHPGFLSRLLRRKQKSNRLEWESPANGSKGYRVVLYYPGQPGDLTITASGRKLKRVRRWAVDQLVAFQKVFDQQVPEVRAELRQDQRALVPVDAARRPAAVGQ